MKQKNLRSMYEAVLFALTTVWKVDRTRILYGIIYNVVKQFFNVFYGVYFLRTILVYIEMERPFFSVLHILCFMLFVNVLFYFLNGHYKEIYLPRFEMKLSQYIDEKIWEKTSEVPYDEYNQSSFLDTYKRILNNTTSNVEKIISSVETMSGLLVALVMILIYTIRVDVFALILSVLPLVYSYFIGGKSEKLLFDLDKSTTKAYRQKEYARRVFYLPQYAKEMKTTSVYKAVEQLYDDGVEENIRQHKRLGKRIAFFRTTEICLSDVVVVILPVAYVIIRVLTGSHFMIGDFLGITQSVTYFGWDLEWFSHMLLDIKSASLYIQEYSQYMEQEYHQDKNHCSKAMCFTHPFVLKCVDVAYTYPGKEHSCALDNVNLSIRQGEKIAIVGENGAGKSTLVSLLMNLLQCTKGQITLNDRDLKEISPEQLKRFFGVVLQDFHLYPISVRDNISINGPLDDNLLWATIRNLGLQHCIKDLDECLTHEFSNDGLELSGGQKQRLALARVIANDYPFIIVDEPTSALDPITEKDIYHTLFKCAADKTLVFISHRLSTTRFVDRIIVMQKGTVVEEGTHQQLMEIKGYYYELYTMQENMYRESV